MFSEDFASSVPTPARHIISLMMPTTSQHAPTRRQALFSLSSFRTTLLGRNYYPHYMNKKTEAQGGKTTCSSSHSNPELASPLKEAEEERFLHGGTCGCGKQGTDQEDPEDLRALSSGPKILREAHARYPAVVTSLISSLSSVREAHRCHLGFTEEKLRLKGGKLPLAGLFGNWKS